MLLLGAILLAIFVLPSPWGIVAVVAGDGDEITPLLAKIDRALDDAQLRQQAREDPSRACRCFAKPIRRYQLPISARWTSKSTDP